MADTAPATIDTASRPRSSSSAVEILNLRKDSTSSSRSGAPSVAHSATGGGSSSGTNAGSSSLPATFENEDGEEEVEEEEAESRSQAETSSASSGSALADAILAGLRRTERIVPGSTGADEQYAYSKEIPTMVLYDDKGLDIYDQITQVEDYYLYGSELAILRRHGEEIASRLFASNRSPASAIEEPVLETGSSEDGSDGDPVLQDSGFHSSPTKKELRERWGDAKSGRNNYGVNGEHGLSPEVAPGRGSVIELGAGSLKKTSVLLRALSRLLRDGRMAALNYYALDLEYGQLVSTLTALGETEQDAVTVDPAEVGEADAGGASANGKRGRKIIARGICASYEDAFPSLKEGRLDADREARKDDRKAILFLGSSIGNYSRKEAVEFLSKISEDAMSAGDSLLIGIDSTDDADRIERAYNDSQGVTRDFILNGADHADRLLGKVGLDRSKFDYVNRYNKPEGRHEAYLRAKEDINLTAEDVHIASGELIRIERSYKYTIHEALSLFASAGLRVVQKWSDDDLTGSYNLYLLEKPLFAFPSTVEQVAAGKNPFGLPTLQEWDCLWKAWDCVTLSMIPRDLLHTKPIDLRHICLFYLGHIPGFLDIHMSRYLKAPYTEPAHYPDMFERGIDPNMDDPSKVHAHSVVPTKMEDWPSVDQIVTYRDRVRHRLHTVYRERLSGPPEKIDRRLARVMQMVHEHEAMHLETLLYMCAQIPPGKLQAAPAFQSPDWQALSAFWDQQVAEEGRTERDLTVSFPASTISVGHDDVDTLDKETPYSEEHTFGWDNESPKRSVQVAAFRVSLLPISNQEYLAFFTAQGSPDQLLPGSWYKREDGGIGVRVLAAPGHVDMEVAKYWPCMAAGKQLDAYARSVGGRLPTEAELRRFIDDHPVDHPGANIGFQNWHPVPPKMPTKLRNGAQAGASNGGVWEWTCTDFDKYEGWQASELYPDYSRDFFDGCHWVMLGGSFATIPRIAGRRTFTNWYQANYPYVFAGARVAYDV